jgi:hypothetical protein
VVTRYLRIQLGIACALSVVAGGLTHAASQTVSRTTQQQQLSKAITLFATDDDSPDAEQLFLRVIKASPVTASDGATARYYLGRLYHRNYYMLNHRNGLERAADRYREVHNRSLGLERKGPWNADARFYKSLVYLQQGKWKDAYESVEHIDPSMDNEIEIDYVVWTINKRSVNRRVPSTALKDQFLSLLKRQNVVMSRRDGADPKTTSAVLAELQRLLERWSTGRGGATAR